MADYLDPKASQSPGARAKRARWSRVCASAITKSPYRGFSVEFVQHREYVPGDDTRHIDWKSYGRSERYTIKAVRTGNELHRPHPARCEQVDALR